jgi:uncharacterized surface protein with fasciclin (FAS1) repeats
MKFIPITLASAIALLLAACAGEATDEAAPEETAVGEEMAADSDVAAAGTSTVTATDVAASNGLVHVIDTVLMP